MKWPVGHPLQPQLVHEHFSLLNAFTVLHTSVDLQHLNLVLLKLLPHSCCFTALESVGHFAPQANQSHFVMVMHCTLQISPLNCASHLHFPSDSHVPWPEHGDADPPGHCLQVPLLLKKPYTQCEQSAPNVFAGHSHTCWVLELGDDDEREEDVLRHTPILLHTLGQVADGPHPPLSANLDACNSAVVGM
jgi:hypothetical protein